LPDSVELVYDSEAILKTAHNIFIDSSSNRLYACGAKTKYHAAKNLMILDISAPDNPVHLRNYQATHYFHDIYVRNDTAYGHHGYDAGAIVYDMSDTGNIDVIGTLPSYTDQGYNHSGWLSPSGDHYVLADETHGSRLKLLDVSDPSNIQEESLFLSGVSNNSIAHNPIIKGSHAFVSHYHDGVYIWDISDPQNPEVAGFYDTYPPNDHDSYKGNWGVYPFLPSGILLASDMQSGLFVFDVDEATGPTALEARKDGPPPFTSYPNPAEDHLRVDLKGRVDGPIEARIIDLRGRRLLEKEWAQAPATMRLSLKGLPGSGVRFLRIRTENGSRTEKFLKR
jgi:choice-of-anchor B domain-containing protein